MTDGAPVPRTHTRTGAFEGDEQSSGASGNAFRPIAHTPSCSDSEAMCT